MSSRGGNHKTAEMRKALKLHGLGQVLPVFLVDDTPRIEVCFECVPCGELLEWTKEAGCWVCALCGYQLDYGHGVDQLEMARDAIDRVIGARKPKVSEPDDSDIDRGRGRRWFGIFR